MPPAVALHVMELPGLTRTRWDTACLTLAEISWIESHRSPALRTRASVSRLLIRTVLGELLGCHPARVPLTVTPQGRPVLTGESAAAGRFSISHDSRLLILADHPGGCGVDVEDSDPDVLYEVADRFCTPGELPDLDPVSARALFSAKESVAKAYGAGLAAGLATITFCGDPRARWVPALRRGQATGLLTRVDRYGDRHLAVSVRTGAPPPVTVTRWRGRPGPGGWRLDRCGTEPGGRPARWQNPAAGRPAIRAVGSPS